MTNRQGEVFSCQTIFNTEGLSVFFVACFPVKGGLRSFQEDFSGDINPCLMMFTMAALQMDDGGLEGS